MKAKGNKYVFAVTKVEYLHHIVANGTLAMDPEKVRAVASWPPPKSVKSLKSFLGVAKYYNHFIKGYSAIIAPLTELLRKNAVYEWAKQ